MFDWKAFLKLNLTLKTPSNQNIDAESYLQTHKLLLLAVFRIRIRPDPKLFGLMDPDPKLIISDPDPDPPLFHTKL